MDMHKCKNRSVIYTSALHVLQIEVDLLKEKDSSPAYKDSTPRRDGHFRTSGQSAQCGFGICLGCTPPTPAQHVGDARSGKVAILEQKGKNYLAKTSFFSRESQSKCNVLHTGKKPERENKKLAELK